MAHPMSKPRTHCWYRVEAERIRARAAAVENDNGLRDSYLRLAREYERLADVLEGRPTPAADEGAPPESAA